MLFRRDISFAIEVKDFVQVVKQAITSLKKP